MGMGNGDLSKVTTKNGSLFSNRWEGQREFDWLWMVGYLDAGLLAGCGRAGSDEETGQIWREEKRRLYTPLSPIQGFRQCNRQSTRYQGTRLVDVPLVWIVDCGFCV